jgi:hypothetical protein
MDFFKTTNWGYIINGLNSMLNDEYEKYLLHYRRFTEKMDEYDNFETFMNDCIQYAIAKKECPNYILSSLVDTILKGKRSFESIDHFCMIISNMLDIYGVQFPTEKLFKRNSDVDDFDISLKDETINYELRSQLLDFLIYYPEVKEFTKLVPKGLDGDFTWKDIPSKSVEEIMDKIDDEDEDEVSDLHRYSVLKYYSVYLKS